jgi:uncharacterized protein (TIGR03435 family)
MTDSTPFMTSPLLGRIAASFALAAGVLCGQVTGPSFEVATIHPAPPLSAIGQQISQGRLHAGMSISPGRVDIGFLSVGDMISIAYRVKPYQVTGPEWMKTDRWDVLATIPQGASKDEVPEMLQALLTERFKLQLHRDIKEQNVYALVVGKEGPKLLDAGASDTDADGKGRGVLSTPQGQLQASADGRSMTVSGGSLGTVRVTMPSGQGGSMKAEMKISMAAMADMLSSLLDKPVVNMTGLQGNFGVSLELSNSEDAKGLMRVAAGVGMIPAPRNAADDPPGNSLFNAVQQLGLRLEARKTPVDLIVVDHLEKKPTEN